MTYCAKKQELANRSAPLTIRKGHEGAAHFGMGREIRDPSILCLLYPYT